MNDRHMTLVLSAPSPAELPQQQLTRTDSSRVHNTSHSFAMPMMRLSITLNTTLPYMSTRSPKGKERHGMTRCVALQQLTEDDARLRLTPRHPASGWRT